MSKNHRGSGIRSLPAHGRGTCAICGKTDIKVLWEKEINGQTVNVCKFCNAKLKNEARVEARKAKPAAEEAAAEDRLFSQQHLFWSEMIWGYCLLEISCEECCCERIVR